MKEYAVYKGDKFIDLGTKEYLAKRLNCKEDTIMWHTTPSAKKRNIKNGLIVIKIEED